MLKRLSALAFVALIAIFSLASLAQATETVTLQVHMGALMQTGGFNPATDSVVIRGDFQVMAGDTGYYGTGLTNQNWGGRHFLMAPSISDDSIYTLAVVFPDTAVGKTINYKFAIINSANPYVDSTTNGGEWESIANNRTYAITIDASQQIPLAYFNDQMPGVTATINITFDVDMTTLLAEGFNPSVDSVYVVGGTAPLNWGWAAGEVMKQDLFDPTTYQTTMQFTDVIGAEVDFKLFGAGRDPFSNGGWESGSNHVMYFTNHDTTVSWVPDLNVTKATTVRDTVTFTVNLNHAYDGINYKSITGVRSVWITGSVQPLNWPPSGWPLADTSKGDTAGKIDTTAQLHKMYDDGTHGDSVAGDNVWAITLVFSPGVSSYVEYKYGALFNGFDTLSVGGVVSGGSLIDNECASGVNHSDTLSGALQFIYNHWGDQDPNNPWNLTGVRENPNSNPKSFMLGQNYPNPFNPTTQINYSVPKNSFVTLKVYNVLGQEVATIFAGNQHAGSYIATFDATRYASGIYFYRMQAGNFSTIKKMVLLK